MRRFSARICLFWLFSLRFSVLLKSVSLAGVCEVRRVSELLLIHMCVRVCVCMIRPTENRRRSFQTKP